MVGEWKEVPISHLYEFRSGLSKPRSEFGFGYGFLSFKHIFYNFFVPDKLSELVNSTEREREYCSIKRGDVFLTRTSETMEELGMSCVALKNYESATFNGFTKRLRPKANTKIVPEYAGYFFRSQKFRREVTAMSSLSTRASLNNEMLGRLTIVLPSFEEQEAIGFILKSFDDKIELNRRMNATLEAMARAIFKSWFVDFDPVRAKAEGRDTGLPDEIATLFPDSFEDSEVGEIPKGWEATPFGNLLEKTIGGDWGKEHRDEKHTRECTIIRGTDIPEINLGSRGKAPTRWVEEKKLKTRQLMDGDIIIEISGGSPKQPTGRSVYITDSILSRLGNTAEPASFCRMFLAKSRFLGLLCAQHLSYIFDIGKMWEYQNQSTGISNFQTKIFLENELLPLPENKQILEAFYTKCRPLIDASQSNESYYLAKLRDTLLPKLISGELRIPDMENFFREAGL